MPSKLAIQQLFHGVTTLGEKGQIVIPAEARETMRLEKGEKLLVFSTGDMLAITKVTSLTQLAAHLSEKLTEIRKILRRNLTAK